MSNAKSIIRQEQVRSWLTCDGLLILGLALAWGLQAISQRRLPKVFAVLLTLVPITAYLLWPRRAAASELRLVSLHSFLGMPGARFAPNQSQATAAQTASWLSDFAERRGAETVLVGVQPDEPHLSDVIFVVGSLSREDLDALSKLGADTRRVSRNAFARRFPAVSTGGQSFYEVIWD